MSKIWCNISSVEQDIELTVGNYCKLQSLLHMTA